MKKLKRIITVTTLALLSCSYAGSISEQLKVADCNFRIIKGSSEIKIVKQMITLRAVSEPGVIASKTSKPTQTNTAGYRAYHLEFSYLGNHIDPLRIKSVEFLIGSKVIHKITIEPDSRRMSESERRKIAYFAINLENVPLLLLDDVTTIKLNN